MEKQGVIPASSSNNGLAVMRPRRDFLFEMIPRWIGVWQRMRFVTPAVAVIPHVKFPLPTLEYLLTNRLNG